MKTDDAYSFENVSQIVKKERGKSLVKLPPDFYEMFAKHMEDLKSRYLKESSKGSASLTAMILADEILKTQRMLDEMIKRRRRKIALAALGEGGEGPVAPSELMPLERQLFDELVAVFKKEKVGIDGLFGGQAETPKGEGSIPQIDIASVIQIAGPDMGPGPQMAQMPAQAPLPRAERRAEAAAKVTAPQPPAPEPKRPAPAAAQPHSAGAKETKGAKERKDGPGTEAKPQAKVPGYTMVRVLADVDSFLAPDKRSYKLRKEDVLELPSQIAELLGGKKKVEIFTA
jgi:DNA replication initiation complex subunit (GINS family)